jgi:hypothetical protein
VCLALPSSRSSRWIHGSLTPPTAHRDDLGHGCANNLLGIKARTGGVTMLMEILHYLA